VDPAYWENSFLYVCQWKQVYYFTFENNNISGGVGGFTFPHSMDAYLPGLVHMRRADVRFCLAVLKQNSFHELEANEIRSLCAKCLLVYEVTEPGEFGYLATMKAASTKK
jgi:hypothetical protein